MNPETDIYIGCDHDVLIEGAKKRAEGAFLNAADCATYLVLGGTGDQIRRNLTGPSVGQSPQALALQLRHSTKTALDQEIVLVLDGDHHYRGVATLPPAHSWYLTLSDTEHHWRIGTVWDTKSAAAINLHPLTSVNPEDQ